MDFTNRGLFLRSISNGLKFSGLCYSGMGYTFGALCYSGVDYNFAALCYIGMDYNLLHYAIVEWWIML
jgi:hypothetical protein